MPISGPVVHRQLTDAYTDAQTRMESARKEISDASKQRDDLHDDRGDALVTLAEHYLPQLTRDAIQATWVEVQPSVTQVLLKKEDHRRRLLTDNQRLTDSRNEHEQALFAINEQLDQLLETQHEVAKQVEQKLHSDAGFVELSDRAAIAEVALERAEANLAEIEQDSQRKLPAYEGSALFRYLRDRQFGTAAYTQRGFTRRIDRWLAKYIDYQKAKQGYEFLRKTPDQMREIIAQDRQAFDTVMDELERRRDQIAVEFGLPEKIEQTQAAQKQRDTRLDTLAKLNTETEAIEHQLTDLDNPRGPYYREAIQLFRQMLEGFDAQDLRQRARRTVEITDDQIVARLMGVDTEIGKLDRETARHRDELDEMQSMLDAMGRLIQQFRAAQFDSSRSQFVGTLDVVDELYRARTEDDIRNAWERIRQAQRWGPTAMEKVTRVATHPMTQVLINAMAHAAGAALESHARRAGNRRARSDTNWQRDWDSSSGNWRRR